MNFGISIDKVYQKVLAIANKEQRGYITPQEFNLFADQAQLDIFEQYFFDVNQFGRIPGNQSRHSDPVSDVEEKITYFKVRQRALVLRNEFGDIFLNKTSVNDSGTVVSQSGGADNIFKLSTIYRRKNNGSLKIANAIDSLEEFRQITASKMLQPTQNYPAYTRYYSRLNNGTQWDRIKISPYIGLKEVEDETGRSQVFMDYIRKPEKPNWGYVVVNEQALYDAATAVDFELLKSEENNLIFKILQLAGITMDPALYQVAAQEEVKEIQQQKS